MTPILLLWFLIAPSLPGEDADARLVAGRLRGKVTRMLTAPVFAALLLWLSGCILGVVGVLAALLTGSPTLAVLGPVPAVVGAAAGGLLLAVVGLRERVWIESLGLPTDWRGPWLAGELADRLGWNDRSTEEPRLDSLSGRATTAFGTSRSPFLAGEGPTPVDRWRPSPAEPTEAMDRGGGPAMDWLDEPVAGTVQLPPIQPRIRGVRFVDAARLRTPPMAEG